MMNALVCRMAEQLMSSHTPPNLKPLLSLIQQYNPDPLSDHLNAATSNEELLEIAAGYIDKQITVLDLSNNPIVTGTTVETLLQLFPELERIHLNHCPNICYKDVDQVFNSLRNLKHLKEVHLVGTPLIDQSQDRAGLLDELKRLMQPQRIRVKAFAEHTNGFFKLIPAFIKNLHIKVNTGFIHTLDEFHEECRSVGDAFRIGFSTGSCTAYDIGEIFEAIRLRPDANAIIFDNAIDGFFEALRTYPLPLM